jgi:hypothetical protein
MTKRQKKLSKQREALYDLYPDSEFMFMNGHDEAIVGIVEYFGSQQQLCYDKEKVLQKLMKSGMTYEEACEYFDFNIIGAYMGEQTPVFIELINI